MNFINFISLTSFIILVDLAPILENLLALLIRAILIAICKFSTEFIRSSIQITSSIIVSVENISIQK